MHVLDQEDLHAFGGERHGADLVQLRGQRVPGPALAPPSAPAVAPSPVASNASAAPTASESSSAEATASASAPEPPAGPVLSTTRFTTFIWRKPMYERDGMIGAFRAGARVPRAAEPYAGKDAGWCKGKWYAVEPVGYVCVGGDGVTLDLDDPTVVAAAAYPPRAEPLPFGYGMSFGAPLYGLVPTLDDQKATEGDVGAWQKQLASMRAKSSAANAWPETALPITPMPSFLEGHARVPATMPGYQVSHATRVGFADAGVRLAFSTAFESDGRAFPVKTRYLGRDASEKLEELLPAMVPTVEAQGGGIYQVNQLSLFMGGEWELRLAIDGAVQDTANPAFDVP